MSVLSPWSLLWLAGVPVLLWLWRLAASSRRIRVSSLVPFEHLLQRRAQRRSRLILNLLFWLQCAALLGAALALAQPVLLGRHGRTLLVILDTSASMEAGRHGSTAFDRAKRLLLDHVRRATRTGEVFVMLTSPVGSLLTGATGDVTAIERAVQGLRVSQLGGSISTTMRIGQALLGAAPDATLVLTDEPAPASLPQTVRWVSVGEPLPNVAIVGLDARGSLCEPAAGRLIVSVENFAARPAQATVRARQGAREVARAEAALAPKARSAIALPLPHGTQGPIEVLLSAQEDGLSADNRAWVEVREPATWPIVVESQRAPLTRAIAAWLDACPALQHLPAQPDHAPYVLITDQWRATASMPQALITFEPPTTPEPVVAPWLIASDHPIGAYLPSVHMVAARLHVADDTDPAGTPVVSSIVEGRRVPILTAEERTHDRRVTIGFDPVDAREHTSMLLLFYNALRWVLGDEGLITTGTPLALHGFDPGVVHVQRPDGSVVEAASIDGVTRYEATTVAGWYRFSQAAHQIQVPVNFLNPVESNVLERVSTWSPEAEPRLPRTRGAADRSRRPLAAPLMWLACALLLAEWWCYTRIKKDAQGAGLSAPGHDATRTIQPRECVRTALSPEPRTMSRE